MKDYKRVQNTIKDYERLRKNMTDHKRTQNTIKDYERSQKNYARPQKSTLLKTIDDYERL